MPADVTEPVTVWLEEEYGYRFWCWDTGMSLDELVLWWRHLETVEPYFMNPATSLPGRLVQFDDYDEWFGHVRCSKQPIVRAHLHDDCDSALTIDDGKQVKLILHCGSHRKR